MKTRFTLHSTPCLQIVSLGKGGHAGNKNKVDESPARGLSKRCDDIHQERGCK